MMVTALASQHLMPRIGLFAGILVVDYLQRMGVPGTAAASDPSSLAAAGDEGFSALILDGLIGYSLKKGRGAGGPANVGEEYFLLFTIVTH